jgi:hypothetical protein
MPHEVDAAVGEDHAAAVDGAPHTGDVPGEIRRRGELAVHAAIVAAKSGNMD